MFFPRDAQALGLAEAQERVETLRFGLALMVTARDSLDLNGFSGF